MEDIREVKVTGVYGASDISNAAYSLFCDWTSKVRFSHVIMLFSSTICLVMPGHFRSHHFSDVAPLKDLSSHEYRVRYWMLTRKVNTLY